MLDQTAPMEDAETELSRFRQQWQAEVTARSQPSSSTAPPPSTSTTIHHQRAPFAPRRLSHREPVPEEPESSSEDEKEGSGQGREELAPLQRERSTSPVATRRAGKGKATVELKSALEHYEKAVEKETQGNLGESLSLYRKAFRMDSKVDTHYREKYYPRPAAGSSAAATSSAPTSVPAAQKVPPASVAALISSFAGLSIPPAGTEDTEVFSPLTTLPHELLLHILHTLAATDIASFARLSKVCKALSHLVTIEEPIWRAVCISAFSKMCWDWKVSVDGEPIIYETLGDVPPPEDIIHETLGDVSPPEDLEEEKRVVPSDEEKLAAYGTWRAMFQSRPRIRFNGIYISTCNYLRQGASQSDWNTPVHIVTYYRYLRFYEDGTVLSLLSTSEPAEVVYGFSKSGVVDGGAVGAPGTNILPSSIAKYVAKGRWRVDPEGRVDVETVQKGMDRYLFRMQLRLGSVRSGGRWVGSRKLMWEGFWSWNKVTDDLAKFSLRNDKAFIFSRVGSIERELDLS